MPSRLQAVFYRAADGSEPVDEFIESLGSAARQAAIDDQIDRINMLIRKDSVRIRERDIRVAEARWDDFKKRMDEERRRSPRAAGDDAP